MSAVTTTRASRGGAGRFLAAMLSLLLMLAMFGFLAYTNSDSVRLRCVGEKVEEAFTGKSLSFPENVVCALAGG
jgi:hypothetical protein